MENARVTFWATADGGKEEIMTAVVPAEKGKALASDIFKNGGPFKKEGKLFIAQRGVPVVLRINGHTRYVMA